MTDRRIIIKCAYCNERTALVVATSEIRQTARGVKQKLIYCEHCERPNIIEISSTWGVRPLVLGDDGVLEVRNGTPVIQGQRA